jgi:hypothetical protein
MTGHPVKVPPELFTEWLSEALLQYDAKSGTVAEMVADRAAQWGADAELEACCDVLSGQWEWDMLSQCKGWKEFRDLSEEILRAARRPEPPSLKQQACDALDAYVYGNADHGDKQSTYNTIRRALEALPDA